MKKIFAGIFTMIAVSLLMAAAATNPYSPSEKSSFPSNVTIYSLGSSSTTDTLYTSSGQVVYGPYSICTGANMFMAKGFQAYMPTGGLASGDSIQFLYQIIPGNQLSDTMTTWNAVDTFITGKKGTYTDISSRAGGSIVFKLINLDASKVGLVARKKLKIAIITTSSETKQ